jgi:predicted nuclease of restriction endonuclease-like (RecB) superfamily
VNSDRPDGTLPRDYRLFLSGLKERIRTAQVKAVLSVNREMIVLYWDLGQRVVERQKQGRWGTGIIERLSRDIQAEFPGIKGFSPQNIWRMRSFYRAWTDDIPILSQPAREFDGVSLPSALAELPWFHNVILITMIKDPGTRLWYAKQALQHGWSRPVLVRQIKSGLHARQGTAVTNFSRTLPPAQSELAREILKDPYDLEFLGLGDDADERAMEGGIVGRIQRFLLELGVGFAFIGRQARLVVGGEEFFMDLLFYHYRLRCFVVVELKAGAFRPEHAGKMNFYLAAVDDLMRQREDRPSIGMILCRSKNRVVVEYSLHAAGKPIGVASYTLEKELPRELRGALPAPEDLERVLREGRAALDR